MSRELQRKCGVCAFQLQEGRSDRQKWGRLSIRVGVHLNLLCGPASSSRSAAAAWQQALLCKAAMHGALSDKTEQYQYSQAERGPSEAGRMNRVPSCHRLMNSAVSMTRDPNPKPIGAVKYYLHDTKRRLSSE